MNKHINLLLASLFLVSAGLHAVHNGKFNITNNWGEVLHVKIMDTTGKVIEGPTPVKAGDNFSMPEIPQVVFAHYPSIKDSGCGLVLKLEELKNKGVQRVYLRVKPIRDRVRFWPLRGAKNNICMKSIRSAKVKYQDWKKELKEKGTVIEEEVVEVQP